ncbi:hypothetical protein [Larkinella punicea]|uniref:Uma2 family endonuclease n=1 Tax=Larkinella punicea TaxID=2315727 RepID=A0A368JI91_9BACT|nr:hypothetical protein [Larkinella punicea]RCR65821.1 hypothetical protein DUE52_30220 [Larkinella punicea]
MYISTTSHLPFVGEEMAIYGPKAHQRIISKLNSGLGPLYYREGRITLEPLPETMLNEGEASPVPDLILYDNETRQTPIIIEICHTEGLKKDLKKVVLLTNEDNYGILESFVYDYTARQWFRYRKGDESVVYSSSFSEILQLDLNSFL